MSSRGDFETKRLKEIIEGQLDRLLTQLEDLDELKNEFTPSEYEMMKLETQQQLVEFNHFLERSVSGNLSLVDAFGSAQLAIQAAVSEAFKTPEVIRMFAEKQPQALRSRFEQLERDLKLQKISKVACDVQLLEILTALSKLGVSLSAKEQKTLEMLSENTTLELAPELDVSQSDLLNQVREAVKTSN